MVALTAEQYQVLLGILDGVTATRQHYREAFRCSMQPRHGMKDDAVSVCVTCEAAKLLRALEIASRPFSVSSS